MSDVHFDRRELMRRGGRWLLLGATGAALAVLGRRAIRECAYSGGCAACPVRDDCALPAAVSRREGQDKEAGHG